MSFHRTIIMGNLGRDPEMRYTPSGDAICNFSVAVTEKYKQEEHTTWYRCSIFGKQAEAAGEYLKKGSAVLAEGRMQERQWTDKDGNERNTWEMRVDAWRFAGGRSSDSSSAPQRQAADPKPAPSRPAADQSGFEDMTDDIPF